MHLGDCGFGIEDLKPRNFSSVPFLAKQVGSRMQMRYCIRAWSENLQTKRLFNYWEKFASSSFYPSQEKWGRSLEILYKDLFKNAWRPVCVCLSTSFSSHTSKVRVLKIGMHNPYIDGSKVNQIFDILLRIYVITIFSNIFGNLRPN